MARVPARRTTSTQSRRAPSRRRTVDLVLPDVSLPPRRPTAACSRRRPVDPGTKRLLLDGPPVAGRDRRRPSARPRLRLRADRAHDGASARRRRRCGRSTSTPRALALCAENAASRTASPTCGHVAPDDVPADVRFADRSGPTRRSASARPALHDLLAALARTADRRTGTAVLVVQQHLGSDSLVRWLERERLAGAATVVAGRLPAARGPTTARAAAGEAARRHRPEAASPRVATAHARRRLALILESVESPFNVGSIVRTAAAYRVEELWLAGSTASLEQLERAEDRDGHRPLPRRRDYRGVGLRRDRRTPTSDGYTVIGLELTDEARPIARTRASETAVCLVVGHEDRGLDPTTIAALRRDRVPAARRAGSARSTSRRPSPSRSTKHAVRNGHARMSDIEVRGINDDELARLPALRRDRVPLRPRRVRRVAGVHPRALRRSVAPALARSSRARCAAPRDRSARNLTVPGERTVPTAPPSPR